MSAAAAGGDSNVSLGKGAWDCDKSCEITPDKEVRRRLRARECEPQRQFAASSCFGRGSLDSRACRSHCSVRLFTFRARLLQAEVFEEIATMEYQFEGIPTVPPRKDAEHLAFFCDGCRYRHARRRDSVFASRPANAPRPPQDQGQRRRDGSCHQAAPVGGRLRTRKPDDDGRSEGHCKVAPACCARVSADARAGGRTSCSSSLASRWRTATH